MRKRAKGDCLRQCVARVTGRKPHRVPDFVNKYKGRWSYYLMGWCSRTGHTMIHIPKGSAYLSRDINRWINIGVARSGRYHAVVMQAKLNKPAEVVYDGGNPLRRVKSCLVILKRGQRR